MTPRERVIAEARTWLSTAYHHQARIKGVGVDCATLLCEVYEAAGVIPYVDPTPYPADWHLHRDGERYLGWLEKYATLTDDPKPGDVVVWRFGRCFSHAAILCDNDTIIHSYIDQGVRLESRHASIFTGRPVKYYTLWA